MAGRPKKNVRIEAMTDKISHAIRETVADILKETFGHPSFSSGTGTSSSKVIS